MNDHKTLTGIFDSIMHTQFSQSITNYGAINDGRPKLYMGLLKKFTHTKPIIIISKMSMQPNNEKRKRSEYKI